MTNKDEIQLHISIDKEIKKVIELNHKRREQVVLITKK